MTSHPNTLGIRLHSKTLDLFAVFIWTIFTVIFVITPFLEGTIIRTILAIPMVLFVPGYTLTVTLFPKDDDLKGIERIALSLGLSMAIVPLMGLLLNFTSGIKLVPLVVVLSFYSTAMLLIAAYRRGKLPEEIRFFVPFYKLYEIFHIGESRIDKILTIILIISVISATQIIYSVTTTPKIAERFTEFYILNQYDKGDSYPVNLKQNYPQEILIGIINHEYSPVNYSVEVSLDKNVLTKKQLTLNHNETWEQNITFTPDREGTDMKLEFLLFKENNFTLPYRQLYLWVNVTK